LQSGSSSGMELRLSLLGIIPLSWLAIGALERELARF
jgi:hypothetical protein